MRAVIQRVGRAAVAIDKTVVGEISNGLCVLIGALEGDTLVDVEFISRKLAGLRIFTDDDGRMNRNLREAGGGVLVVPQFTLAADTTSGNRPSFSNAMAPEQAAQLIEQLCGQLAAAGLNVQQGVFGAKMAVSLVNEGPVTIYLDSRQKHRR